MAHADDALLESTAGGLCCGTTANLLVRRSDRWLTPPLSSGCLPGVMRSRTLALGLAEEAELTVQDLHRAEAALLINSLGCRRITAVGAVELSTTWDARAEAFHRNLRREEAGTEGIT